ncbi:MAG: purine-nucleoside phosphorylase [Candidatus Methanosuratus sp.]|nr:purine-nucleoside phosphorylase [Candidatus Methanosuratincola sp.]
MKCVKGDVAERVVVFGDPCRTKASASLLERSRLVSKERCLLTYTGEYMGTKLTLSTTGMGTPSAAIVCEELAALGARCIIRSGTMGSISSVAAGDAVVPTEAIPLDGTARAYMEKFRLNSMPSASRRIAEMLRSTALSKGVRTHVGPICTSDVFYLEGGIETAHWQEKGVLGFEMECSAIFAIGAARGYEGGAILAVTGSVSGEERVLGGSEVKNAIERCTLSALETATSVELPQIK